jgi:signal transduction histidine kinase
MNIMDEQSGVNLEDNVRFLVNSHLSYPSAGCQERTHMPSDHKRSIPQDKNVVFIHHQPEMQFRIENTDRATLQWVAQQNERKRIAQELHDTLLQGFTCVSLKLDALTSGLPLEMSETKEQLQKILEQTDEYLSEARRAIWGLRSTALDGTEDLPGALVKASKRALAGTSIELSFCVQGAEHKIQRVTENNLLRICEEAVANAVKHARPTQVEVTLEFNSDAVQLRVRDDGCGFDPARTEAAKRGHFGLVGIKERVEALSGMLSIDSAPDRGTSLWVIIPTDARQRNHGRESLMSSMRTNWLWAKASYI